MAPSLLFITRKYPPSRGGMEEFSQRLFAAYPGPKRLVALRRAQAWLPLFILRVLVEAWCCRRAVEHVHLGDALLTPLAPLIGRLTGARVTATVHGLDVTRNLPLYRWSIGRALRRVSGGVAAVSGYTADQVRSLYHVRAAVITNGVSDTWRGLEGRVDDPVATRARLGLPPDGPLIVTVGRLVERKGVAWFIEQVMPSLPPDVAYAVVGDGPHRRRVREAAAQDGRAFLLGARGDRDVAALYMCATLFVAPNIDVPGHPEGYGIAPAEAVAAGLPALVSDIQGLRDMAADTGVPTVPAGNAAAWAAAVRHVLRDPDSGRATRRARSWATVAEDYARLFTAARARPVQRDAAREPRRPARPTAWSPAATTTHDGGPSQPAT